MKLSSVVGVIFVVLKLTHLVAWSWIWVLAPFWITALFWIALVLIAVASV